MSSCSSRATRRPRSAASCAMPSPLTPAPTTTTSNGRDSSSTACLLGGLDDGDDGAHLDRVALVDEDLGEGAGGRGLQRLLDLLCLDLGERLVLGDGVADALVPGEDRAFA